jgi:4-hydroxy-tetrahydrodipicolinate synthase
MEGNNMSNEQLTAKDLSGGIPAMVTPMRKSRRGSYLNIIDYGKTEMLIDDFNRARMQAVVPCGTTGQSSTMSEKLHLHFAETVDEIVDGNMRVIFGCGSNNPEEAIKRLRAWEKRKGSPGTALIETGYKNNPTQKGIYEFYMTILGNTRYTATNIILYNVPSRTGSNMEADTIIALAKNDRIIGLKEASGTYVHKIDGDMISKVKKIVARTNPDTFRVMSGEDDLVVKVIEAGGYGTISATANAAPLYFKDMCDEANKARERGTSYETADKMQVGIMSLVDAVFMRKNPIPLGIMFGTELKLPMTREEDIVQKVYEIMLNYDPKKTGIDFTRYNPGFAEYKQSKAA